MRRWFITCAVLANALASGVLLLLVPVLTTSSWTRNRELRGLNARLVPRRAAPPA